VDDAMKKLRAIIAAQIALLLSWCSSPMPVAAEVLPDSYVRSTITVLVVMFRDEKHELQWMFKEQPGPKACEHQAELIRPTGAAVICVKVGDPQRV
jgi:hypothetical protein